MAICPKGHQTKKSDFCHKCGAAIAPEPQAGHQEILAAPVHHELENPPRPAELTGGAEAASPQSPGSPESPKSPRSPKSAASPASPKTPQSPQSADSAGSPQSAPSRDPQGSASPRLDWVAEIWVDADWYQTQGSTDPLPGVGIPDIAPLVKPENLVGRVSNSRGIFPDVDCELDVGCSRRHAMLSTDGSTWWVEDLDSANGTFLGKPDGPLPAMPIPRGKVEIHPGQPIYLGAWTRLIVRRATDDERELFAD